MELSPANNLFTSIVVLSHAIKTVRRIKRSGGALEDRDVDLQLLKRRK